MISLLSREGAAFRKKNAAPPALHAQDETHEMADLAESKSKIFPGSKTSPGILYEYNFRQGNLFRITYEFYF